MSQIRFSILFFVFSFVTHASVECPPYPLQISLTCENKNLVEPNLQLVSHEGIYNLDSSKSQWNRTEKILKCVYTSVDTRTNNPWKSTYIYEGTSYAGLSSKNVLRDLVRSLPSAVLPQSDIHPVSYPFFEIHYRVSNKELLHETYIFTTGLEYIVSRNQISGATEEDELLTAIQKNFSRMEPQEDDYLVTGSNCSFRAEEINPFSNTASN